METTSTKMSDKITKSALFQTLYPIVVMLIVFGLVFFALYCAL